MQLKSTYSALAIAALLSTVSAAKAADILKPHAVKQVIIAPAAPNFSWAGPYLGVELGSSPERFYSMDKGRADVTETINSLSKPDNPILTGIYGGYNFQLGQHAIIGIDGNIDLHNANTQTIDVDSSPLSYTAYKERAEAAIRLRLAYAQGRFLPYIAGGFSVLRSGFATGLALNGIPTSNKMLANNSGWNIGAGMELMVAHNISLRADYRFNKIKIKNSYDILDGVWTKDKNYIGVKSNQFRIGLGYKF